MGARVLEAEFLFSPWAEHAERMCGAAFLLLDMDLRFRREHLVASPVETAEGRCQAIAIREKTLRSGREAELAAQGRVIQLSDSPEEWRANLELRLDGRIWRFEYRVAADGRIWLDWSNPQSSLEARFGPVRIILSG